MAIIDQNRLKSMVLEKPWLKKWGTGNTLSVCMCVGLCDRIWKWFSNIGCITSMKWPSMRWMVSKLIWFDLCMCGLWCFTTQKLFWSMVKFNNKTENNNNYTWFDWYTEIRRGIIEDTVETQRERDRETENRNKIEW